MQRKEIPYQLSDVNSVKKHIPLLRILKNFLSDQELFHEDVISRKLSHTEMLPYTNEDFFSSVVHCLKSCQRTILENFTRRFTGMDFSILWVTYLDPRCRNMKHLSESERMNAKSSFIDETVELCLASNREIPVQTNEAHDESELKKVANTKTKTALG